MSQSLQLIELLLRRLFHVRSLRGYPQLAIPVGIDGPVGQHQRPALSLQDHLVDGLQEKPAGLGGIGNFSGPFEVVPGGRARTRRSSGARTCARSPPRDRTRSTRAFAAASNRATQSTHRTQESRLILARPLPGGPYSRRLALPRTPRGFRPEGDCPSRGLQAVDQITPN
jgi:hypothetical protein